MMQFTTHDFADAGDIPNNPDLPLILYRAALVEDGTDRASAFERLFTSHGWGGSWRNGMYPFDHYHSTAHEVLGIASGTVTVQLGGDAGLPVDLVAGDAVLIPAGVGHRRIASSSDLIVVGAYPMGQRWDLVRADDVVDAGAVRTRIRAVTLPAEDPLAGSKGPLAKHWTTG
ncbi:cupin domain-containing protein [Kaistia terrae]|uniref:Cupin domain-containing protein n=1 Tax=Kaistia terrae TaxID=537017 RepID=A0ABW0PRV5_9HYPH|nr:cupin domain-containing protein [Kaistia terrae]MCX5578313.1 cupin domain-containing protein [Kaistia terrae]